MNVRELLLLALAGWTAIGVVGTSVSFATGERAKAVRGIGWIVGVWLVYLGVLIAVSLKQKQRVVAIGQPECFNSMCFTVTHVDEVAGLPPQNDRRLVRVTINVKNRGHKRTGDDRIQVYLIDAQGRQWGETPGLSGVRLTARVGPGDSVLSEPVFAVTTNATALELIFTQGKRQPGVLVIGDTDSLLHQRTIIPLGR
jgi:hypothetical protein